ncbi:raffinose/stachyose/melibiose transport system substrate-binding protein [Micromonospora phaseoli]|uniref:Raffinose/stachyose/melibiose transport system substrate-binding protein n=1 Tax=Micromonospora phaseoli TaxID=1144548 RepID=A0A1H6S7Y5_9ACTN|nr:extracellular solute-binding protein [Micromonospora phaseoli]PZW03727.1 raffinose/stachyose/melibiose transport system substrate-binding protein [Micromonospora phaseoli]GIJ80288.1 ABC transporter substrate-binding protein [Micromonospora phaseoli]SEI60877.1 raffinose/stachyose/melibiose transport system substrate-binding protein [Micromonospora phaseoli]
MTAHISRRSLLGLAGLGAGTLLLGACGDDGTDTPGDPQTINWWHVQDAEPMLSVWADFAKQYEGSHTNVTIEVQPLEVEAFKTKLDAAVEKKTPPDLFQSWGGGALQQQVEAGLVKDITEDVKEWIGQLLPAAVQPYTVDNRIYGIPFDIGMVGFWYNRDHFAKAGIETPPATWAQLLVAVGKLKSAGIVPIALGGKDKWPGHYYWAYLAMRIGGLEALARAAEDRNFDTPDFVAAGEHFKELVDMQPFQPGFLRAEYGSENGQAATMGNEGAAMELMGQWAPSVQASSSTSQRGLGDRLAFFPFPAVEGGKGAATDAFGGGNGFAVGRDAPASTVEFLRTLLQAKNQRRAAQTGAVLPTNQAATGGIKDLNNQVVAANLGIATGFQLYLDQAYPPAVGQQINNSAAELVAGTKGPAQIVKDITRVAKRQ